MSGSWRWTVTCRRRYASPREKRWSAINRGKSNGALRNVIALPLFFPAPVRPHLRHAFPVDRRALALFFAPHRSEEVEGFLEVGLNGLPRRREVQAADFRELVFAAQHR